MNYHHAWPLHVSLISSSKYHGNMEKMSTSSVFGFPDDFLRYRDLFIHTRLSLEPFGYPETE